MENKIYSGYEEKSWKEFQESGLLWWLNRSLHLFGWAIVMDEYEDKSDGRKLFKVYPARCSCRGFSEQTEELGFKRVTEYIKKNVKDLIKDVR